MALYVKFSNFVIIIIIKKTMGAYEKRLAEAEALLMSTHNIGFFFFFFFFFFF